MMAHGQRELMRDVAMHAWHVASCPCDFWAAMLACAHYGELVSSV